MARLGADRPRVWIVDDSPTDGGRAAAALHADYEVELFSDGPSVLQRLAVASPPDALVLDWLMPDITGVDVVRLLRQSHRLVLQELRVLLLTAMGRPEQVAEGLHAGADDYLAKPYETIELRARVAALIRSRQLADRVRSAERAIRELLMQGPDAIVVVDSYNRITWVNQEAEALVDIPCSELIGCEIEDILPDLDWTRIRRLGRVADFDWRGRIYSPSVRVVDDEALAGTVLALRDVTEKRLAEQRRLDFYSMIAHDLRSPLQSAMMRTHLLGNGRFGDLPSPVVRELERIEDAGREMVSLIDDFLEIARSDSLVMSFEREPVDLRELVGNMLEEHRRAARAQGITLRDTLGGEARVVQANARRLRQVITNLLTNALKFTPAGGEVHVRLLDEGDYVRVEVCDTGRGIDPALRQRLFQRYVRHDDDDVHGTGLGLMIVREVVEAHGGRVGVDSLPGQGSRFWIDLPRMRARRT